jgi:hypothetical protein
VDHVTAAALPEVRVAENCSTAVPAEFLALQPTQFVSMLTEPGAMANVPLDTLAELVATLPPPQPAIMHNIGRTAAARIRNAADRRLLERGLLAALACARIRFVTRLSSIKSSNAFK